MYTQSLVTANIKKNGKERISNKSVRISTIAVTSKTVKRDILKDVKSMRAEPCADLKVVVLTLTTKDETKEQERESC